MLNAADKITLLRVAAVPIIVVLLYFPTPTTCAAASIIFILACLTDMFDGMVARRYNLVSSFGKFLDPLADKILVGSVLVMLVGMENSGVPAWVVIIILAREFMVTGLRAMASEKGIVMAADKLGKIKTVLQIAALIPLILHYPVLGFDPVFPGAILLYMALAMTIVSGWNYLFTFMKNWVQQEQTAQ